MADLKTPGTARLVGKEALRVPLKYMWWCKASQVQYMFRTGPHQPRLCTA